MWPDTLQSIFLLLSICKKTNSLFFFLFFLGFGGGSVCVCLLLTSLCPEVLKTILCIFKLLSFSLWKMQCSWDRIEMGFSAAGTLLLFCCSPSHKPWCVRALHGQHTALNTSMSIISCSTGKAQRSGPPHLAGFTTSASYPSLHYHQQTISHLYFFYNFLDSSHCCSFYTFFFLKPMCLLFPFT